MIKQYPFEVFMVIQRRYPSCCRVGSEPIGLHSIGSYLALVATVFHVSD